MNTSFIAAITAKGEEVLINMDHIRSVQKVPVPSANIEMQHWCKLNWNQPMNEPTVIQMEIDTLQKLLSNN